MAPVAIVTDTTHYMPRELVASNDLTEVSLYVNWAGRTDRESELPDFDAFYEHLRGATDTPTTSQPSVGDFVEAYEPLLAAGRDVVSIHLAAGISGTYGSALAAKQQLEEELGAERITVVDSKSTCGGMGGVLLAAAKAARAGASREEIASVAGEARAGLEMWFAVDTLEFLRRGGRIGAAQAWLGTALKIKPILTLGEEVLPVERVRTSGRAFERLVEYAESRMDDGIDGWIVQHIQAADQAERLVQRGREIFGNEPLFVSEIGPVIGTHAGPGLLGIGALPRELIE